MSLIPVVPELVTGGSFTHARNSNWGSWRLAFSTPKPLWYGNVCPTTCPQSGASRRWRMISAPWHLDLKAAKCWTLLDWKDQWWKQRWKYLNVTSLKLEWKGSTIWYCLHVSMVSWLFQLAEEWKRLNYGTWIFLIYFKPSAFVFSATFVTCISAIEQLQHRWSLGLFSCSRIASVHLLSPERNVTPVAKELANPEDRRIEKISFRALTKHEKHEPIRNWDSIEAHSIIFTEW